MKFPQNVLARAGVLTAGAGGEMTGVCTALALVMRHGTNSAKNLKFETFP